MQGLFRFDGVEFERVPLEGRDPNQHPGVYSLFAEESGDLWVTYVFGGVTHISNGSMRHYGEADGLPATTVMCVIRDSNGAVWAGGTAGLLQFDGKRWHRAGVEAGFTDAVGFALELDGSGALWVVGDAAVFRRRAHKQHFERTGHSANSGNAWLMRSADGSLWYNNLTQIYRLTDQISGAARPKHANSRQMFGSLFDRDGHLWATEGTLNIVRVRVPANAEQIRYADTTVARLTDRGDRPQEMPLGMLEDHEGNIWVLRRDAVERFHPMNFRRLDLGHGNSAFHALEAEAGVLWIGQTTIGALPQLDGVLKFDGRRLTRVAPKSVKEVAAAARAANGTLWFAGPQGVWRKEQDGRFTQLPQLPASVRFIVCMVIDEAGKPWISAAHGGLYQFSDGRWQPNGGRADLPTNLVLSQTRAPDGTLWFGYRENQLARVATDRVTIYGAQQGLQLGVIGAIHVGRFTTVAGQRAIALLDGERFHILRAEEDEEALAGVSGITEDLNGDLWLNGFRGAVRIAREDLEAALHTERQVVRVEIFDARDGYPGVAQQGRPVPTVTRDYEGRVWFAGSTGVGWLRPDNVRRNAIPPPVKIRSLLSENKTYPIGERVDLPVSAHDVQFNYTALTLSRPERARFRYRLAGYDDAWIEAGVRRQAIYTNLAPGEYRFQVIAANEHGLWNETGASVRLIIPPTFAQTRTFLALCVFSSALLIWGAIALRVKQLTMRERSRLEERLGERERIARELHDTLLQSAQGLILRLQTTIDEVDVPGTARAAMNTALDRAEALLCEGRDRVKDLRGGGTESQTLKQTLLAAAEQMSIGQNVHLRVMENGTPSELHPIVREEAARITIEAMSNALRHAAANSIEVELSYDRRALRINIKDDGRGMEASVLSDGREGHFGFAGMKERAGRIRGTLRIWSRPAAGTEVNLTVPAGMAYVRRDWKNRFTRVLRQSFHG